MVINMQDARVKNTVLDKMTAMIIIALMSLGTVFVVSASANLRNSNDLQKLIFFPAAVIVMFAVSLIPYRWFSFKYVNQIDIYDCPNPVSRFCKQMIDYGRSLSSWMLIISIILLILVLIPQFGNSALGARRWISIGPISFQPSELAKWTTFIVVAAFIDRDSERIKAFFKGFMPVCCLVGLVCGLILLEDFGTAAFIGFMVFIMLIIGGAKIWHFLLPMLIAAPVGYYAIISEPYRVARIKAFFNPESPNNPALYQVKQSLIAISTGGMHGKGLGQGICKWDHLPEDTTDFIFAVISEELGFGGCCFVLLMFTLFAIVGLMIVRKCQDVFGKILAATIVIAICFQAAVNIGVVTVMLPTKGIPLPFISAGGTSLLTTACAIGILLNIARTSEKEEMVGMEYDG